MKNEKPEGGSNPSGLKLLIPSSWFRFVVFQTVYQPAKEPFVFPRVVIGVDVSSVDQQDYETTGVCVAEITLLQSGDGRRNRFDALC
ncbi:MAG TPA: hypothetical protein VHC68_01945 [Candidatus Paceibacterota bacterium]|nr:hypothetical protein [Candidatus Paceibacterota bacterium]